MARRWCVVAGVSLGVAGIGLAVGFVRAQVGAGNTGSSDQGAAQRVQAQVAEVSAESVLESIANLVQPDIYFWPGGRSDRYQTLAFPLLPEEGQEAIDTILSNRRFLRVCEELSAVRPQEAGAVLNEALPVCLESYRIVLDAYIAERAERVRPGVPLAEQVGPSFQIGGPSDGRPNPLGERYRLLALVFIAGNLALDGAHEAVEQVVAEALAQRERFYRDDEFHEGFRLGMLTDASLYNRQILGHALLKTCADPMLIDEVVAALRQDLIVKELTAFDAQRTRYDARLMPGPVDYSKGVLEVEYLPPITDQEFDTIVAAVLSAEQQAAEEEESQ